MQELDDIALLREYAEKGSEAAFAALVERHVDRVYSVALRHTGNPHQAEEITQAVFVILAKKARSLRKGVILEGWLYQTARLTAVTLVRSEIRRARREQKSMQTISHENEGDAWSQIVPLLDGALAGLNETDRNAVVLRFFYGKSLREVGSALGASEDSARMRINRALEKLREYFLRHGVASTAAIIAGAMSANSVQAAPVTLAKLATAAALAKGAAGSVSAVTAAKGVLKIMAWTKVQTTIVGAVIVGMAAYSVLEHQARARLRVQNETLQRQVAGLQVENQRLADSARAATPRLPAQAGNASLALPVDVPTTNLYNRFKENTPLLSAQQVDAFLQKNGRKVSALLAAYRTSHDVGLLREAMGKYPEDPQVAFEVVTSPWLTADEKRPWLKTFEQTNPENSLANYLLAIDDLKSGQTDGAMRELANAAGKRFDDYTQSRIQDDVDAYLSAGYSIAEAQTIASQSLLLPEFSPLKGLGRQMVDLANSYQQAGDPTSAQAALEMALKLGQTLAAAPPTSPVLARLVGTVVEQMALGAMDPNASLGNGQTVRDELNRITQSGQATKNLIDATKPLLSNLTDDDWVNFLNRCALFGEPAAMQWVMNKYGQQ